MASSSITMEPGARFPFACDTDWNMAATAQVSVEEYLHSTFEHDAEYVEGRIVARSEPQKAHSKMQARLVRRLSAAGDPLGYAVWLEQRILTQRAPARYRVPDLCVTQGQPSEDVFTEPPFLCVEILSPDDTAVEVWAKVREYLAFGVATCGSWIPTRRRARSTRRKGRSEWKTGDFAPVRSRSR